MTKNAKTVLLLILSLTLLLSMCACNGSVASQADNRKNYENSKDSTGGTQDNAEETGDKQPVPDDGRTYLDAFEGMKLVVSGISPYCQVAVNNQNCAADVQKYVEYSFDKEYYANGETVVVTASLNWSADSSVLALLTEEQMIKVSGQPEYITSVEGVDLSLIENELQDYVKSQIASSIGDNEFFGCDYYDGLDLSVHYFGSMCSLDFDKIDAEQCKSYFSSLKLNKQATMGNSVPFNKLTFVYCFNVYSTVDTSTLGDYKSISLEDQLWVAISSCNVIKYPDGSIKWGTTGPERYDFVYGASTTGLEYCVTTCIMTDSADYNITERS